jgi:hypothetical protein
MRLLYLYTGQDAQIERAVNKEALSPELQLQGERLVRLELTTLGLAIRRVCMLSLLERAKIWICS